MSIARDQIHAASVVDNDIVVGLLSEHAARSLTDEVKADAATLWAKLLHLYEGGAHTALGYASWGAYYGAEFGESGRRGYQVLKAAEVVAALEPVNNCSLPSSEAVARELVPVLRDAPEDVPEVWGEVVEEYGPTPTAAQVREVVDARREEAPARPVKVPCPTCGHLVKPEDFKRGV